MSIVPSTLVAIGSDPGPNEVWDMAHLLFPNWSNPFVNRTQYVTEVAFSISDTEQRRTRMTRPLLSTAYRLAGWNRVQDILSSLYRNSQARSLSPLFSDTASGHTSDREVITMGVSYRRISVGQRVLVWKPSTMEFAVRTVLSMVKDYDAENFESAESITVAILPSNFTGFIRVTPLFEASLSLLGSVSAITDEDGEFVLEGEEVAGPWQLLSHAVPGDADWLSDPENTLNRPFDIQLGYPVLDILPNFQAEVALTVQRQGTLDLSGLLALASVYGERARAGYNFTIRTLDRIRGWRMKQLCDYASGRSHPFWVASPISEFRNPLATATTIVVDAVGPLKDWDFRPHIAVMTRSGEHIIRPIASVTRDAGKDTVTFNTPWVPDIIRRVYTPRLCRFESDEIIEEWTTPTICDWSMNLIEVGGVDSDGVGDRDITIPGLVDPADNTDPLPEPWTPDFENFPPCCPDDEEDAPIIYPRYSVVTPESKVKVTWDIQSSGTNMPEWLTLSGPNFPGKFKVGWNYSDAGSEEYEIEEDFYCGENLSGVGYREELQNAAEYEIWEDHPAWNFDPELNIRRMMVRHQTFAAGASFANREDNSSALGSIVNFNDNTPGFWIDITFSPVGGAHLGFAINPDFGSAQSDHDTGMFKVFFQREKWSPGPDQQATFHEVETTAEYFDQPTGTLLYATGTLKVSQTRSVIRNSNGFPIGIEVLFEWEEDVVGVEDVLRAEWDQTGSALIRIEITHPADCPECEECE